MTANAHDSHRGDSTDTGPRRRKLVTVLAGGDPLHRGPAVGLAPRCSDLPGAAITLPARPGTAVAVNAVSPELDQGMVRIPARDGCEEPLESSGSRSSCGHRVVADVDLAVTAQTS